MNTADALKLFEDNNCTCIIVQHATTGTQYYLHKDIVEAADEDFVYGYYVKHKPRRKGTYKWFDLKNVKFVSAEVRR